MTMKSGANFKDQAAIKKLAKDGAKADEIAETLKLPLDCVKSFMPGAKKKAPARSAE